MTLEWPAIVNLRLDPVERATLKEAWPSFFDFYGREMWRFLLAQKAVEQLGKTFVEYPPLQKGAHFNMEGVEQEVKQAISSVSSVKQ